MDIPYQAYYRIWLALGQTEVEHERFHTELWVTKTDFRVARIILDRIGRSEASEADKLAVVAHVTADWQQARQLASMASATTCFDVGSFGSRLKILRDKAGLTLDDLATAAGVTKQSLSLYERGDRRPTWDAVQKLAAALGVPTDAFRDLGAS